MLGTRALLLSALLIAAAIVAHGFLTRPPRYTFVAVAGSKYIARGDKQTGVVASCVPSEDNQGYLAFTCPSR